MDVLDTYAVVSEAVERVRSERRPLLVEAVTYRFRGHSMADPEQYRSKEEVAQWRERDPLPAFAELLERERLIDETEHERIDADAIARVDAAVAFADSSPFPAPESLYDDVYVLGGQSQGWYSVATAAGHALGTPPGAEGEGHQKLDGAQPSANDEIPQQLTHALAAGEDRERPEETAP
jgi:TPP-dependent pyruvate/acetoin dehydrogenase alpha subunit